MTLSLIETRRYLHSHPEPSFKEYETSAWIADFLESIHIPYQRCETAVIATLDTGRNGRHMAFRADIDGLCLDELNTVDYRSVNTGIMHACGHDAHTAILLHTVKNIAENVEIYSGKFTFIFQHGEEVPPGGARLLVSKGYLDGVHTIYGLHCDPEIPLGKVMSKSGPLMAAVDKFTVTVVGKGGHGAMPHRAVDPVVLASQIIMSLQTIISRNTDPLEAALITIGKIHGGESFNVIPESVVFEGTVRTLSHGIRIRTEQRIRQILDGMTMASDAGYNLEWIPGYPVLENHEEAVSAVEAAAKRVLGENGFVRKDRARLLGEDFASYLEVVPGAFFFLGTNGGKASSYPLHSPRFDIDERALAYGVGIYLDLARGGVL